MTFVHHLLRLGCLGHLNLLLPLHDYSTDILEHRFLGLLVLQVLQLLDMLLCPELEPAQHVILDNLSELVFELPRAVLVLHLFDDFFEPRNGVVFRESLSVLIVVLEIQDIRLIYLVRLKNDSPQLRPALRGVLPLQVPI